MLRIIDANLNRAREALRVLEDIARFVHDDRLTSSRLKSIRHSLTEALQPLAVSLIRARDVNGDVQKFDRRARPEKNLRGLTAANFKRAQEALRSLEEAITLITPALHPRFMSLRFQVYELERSLARRQQLIGPLEHASLYVIIQPSLCRLPPREVCRRAVKGGADIIQLRAPEYSDRRLLNMACDLREAASAALLIINDRPHVAVSAHADGVHVGESDLPVDRARSVVGDFMIVGATSHRATEARAAKRLGADYVSYGPVFSTPLKPNLKPAGYSYLPAVKKLGIPFFPIGGINSKNVRGLTSRGVRRVAVCSAVVSSPDPEKAARLIKRRLASPSP
jgi:thiamine-phosphate pyrophosphorylase